jgi:small subunit ribosomal protein S11
MGKKRIVKKGETESAEKGADSAKVSSKHRVDVGRLCVESTYNNTKVVLTDAEGNTLAWSTSGALGFKGAKKGTPFAAAKIGETLSLKAQQMGMREVAVIIKGVGSGREAAVRGFVSKGIAISSIKDETPVPHNGPKAKKPRRV